MTRAPAFLSNLALTGALAVALAGCKGEEKPAQDARAAGEILPGSASDAMIPYDTIRSQPPLAPKPTGAAGSGAPRDGGDAADEDAAEADASPPEAPMVSVPAAAPTEE